MPDAAQPQAPSSTSTTTTVIAPELNAPAPARADATVRPAIAPGEAGTANAQSPEESRVPAGEESERLGAVSDLTIISRSQIEQNGWHSLADILGNVTGFYLSDDGTTTSVAARGLDGGLQAGTRLVAVMINGIPVNFLPERRAFLGPEYIPIDTIERVEVVKGPFRNALLGTVNVVTRSAAPGSHASASGMALSQNENRAGYGGSGMATYASDRVELLLGVSSYMLNRSGLSIQRTFAAQNPSLARYAPLFEGPSRHDLATPSGAFFRLVLRSSSNHTLSLDAGFQHHDASAEFRLNSVLTHQSRESLRNAWVQARYRAKWSEWVASELGLGVSTGGPTRDDQFFLVGQPGQTFTRNFGYRALNAGLAMDFTPGKRLSLRVGLDTELELEDILFYTTTFAVAQGNRAAGESVDLIDVNVDRRKTISKRGAYLEVNAQPALGLPSLRLSGEVRLDGVSYSGYGVPAQLSVRAGVAYAWASWFTSKLLVGRGFHAPSGVLMFAQAGFGISNNLVGNLAPTAGVPRLVPEKLDTAELIFAFSIGDAKLQVTSFVQRVTDRIRLVSTGSDFAARNRGEQTLVGGEAVLRGDFGRVGPFASGALAESTDGSPLTAYPRFVGTAGIELELLRKPRLQLNGRVRHVSSRSATEANQTLNGNRAYSLPSYQTLDSTLSLTALPLLGKDTDTGLFLSAQNLLDQRHSEPGYGGFDLPILGRSAFFEVRQSF